MSSSKFLNPGSTIGILGGGQLGKMLSNAAKQMGYKVHIYSNAEDSCSVGSADKVLVGDYSDINKMLEFSRGIDLCTFEFENIPCSAYKAISDIVLCAPNVTALEITQDRTKEKTFLKERGLPVARFECVKNGKDVKKFVREFGFPCIIKTSTMGYDGKGQWKVNNKEELERIHELPNNLILEEFIDLSFEFSLIGGRSYEGKSEIYPPFLNVHKNQILYTTVTNPTFPKETELEAKNILIRIMGELDFVGVLCVEFFVKKDNTLLVNEIAPRVHNSGHLTIEASTTSQFVQHIRAITGNSLGSTKLLSEAAMINLLGDIWNPEPNWRELTKFPDINLHLYGKSTAKPGRKMGHLTALSEKSGLALSRVTSAMERLSNS